MERTKQNALATEALWHTIRKSCPWGSVCSFGGTALASARGNTRFRRPFTLLGGRQTWLHTILADASRPRSKYLASAELAGQTLEHLFPAGGAGMTS